MLLVYVVGLLRSVRDTVHAISDGQLQIRCVAGRETRPRWQRVMRVTEALYCGWLHAVVCWHYWHRCTVSVGVQLVMWLEHHGSSCNLR